MSAVAASFDKTHLCAVRGLGCWRRAAAALNAGQDDSESLRILELGRTIIAIRTYQTTLDLSRVRESSKLANLANLLMDLQRAFASSIQTAPLQMAPI